MYFRNTETRYGLVTILLHWTMAILITGLFVLGKSMVGLGYYDPWYHIAPWWHKSIGIYVFILLVIRLFLRFSNITPVPLQSNKPWEITIAKTVHFLIYILLFGICISGYFIATAKGVGIEVFGWFNTPAAINLSDTQADIAGKTH